MCSGSSRLGPSTAENTRASEGTGSVQVFVDLVLTRVGTHLLMFLSTNRVVFSIYNLNKVENAHSAILILSWH